MTSHWRLTVGAILTLLFVAALSFGRRVDSYSCAGCRNHKRVETTTLLGADVRSVVTTDREHQLPVGHVHRWWDYSHYREQGVLGLLGAKVDCKSSQFEDGVLTAQAQQK